MERRPGRPRAGAVALSAERILATALRLVDERGVEALSMRRLAAELGVDAMAIYHHLPDKRAVIAGLVERVFAELQVAGTPNAGWQDQVRAFAAAYYGLARAHANLVLHLVTHPAWNSRSLLAANEQLYAAFSAAGLAPQQVAAAADLVVDYLNGYVLGESAALSPQAAGLAECVRGVDGEAYPTLRQVFAALADAEQQPGPWDGLEIILAGIAALAARSRSRDAGRCSAGG